VNGWIVLAVVAGIILFALLANRFGLIDLSNKSRSGGSSGGFGVIDEIYNPSQYNAQIELDRQTILPAPAPLPGDRDKGILDAAAGQYTGRMNIDLR
jgi:hypothetical protein